MPITKDEINLMIKTAIETEKNAFIYKSEHKFGACVMTSNGQVFGGCNIEGPVSGLGSCAEISAINHAIIHGFYDFRAILVVDETEFIYPCGMCLQYISQFEQITGKEIEIISAKENGEYEIKNLSELLPNKYTNLKYDQIIKSYANK